MLIVAMDLGVKPDLQHQPVKILYKCTKGTSVRAFIILSTDLGVKLENLQSPPAIILHK